MSVDIEQIEARLTAGRYYFDAQAETDITALITEVRRLRGESAELLISRAGLADEAQKLRDWRDGPRSERAERAALQAKGEQ